jgi:hypothetical protein
MIHGLDAHLHKTYTVYGREMKYRCRTWGYSPIGSKSQQPIPCTSAVDAGKCSVLSITSVQSVVGIVLNDRTLVA